MDATVALAASTSSSTEYGSSIPMILAEFCIRTMWSVSRKTAGPWAVS